MRTGSLKQATNAVCGLEAKDSVGDTQDNCAASCSLTDAVCACSPRTTVVEALMFSCQMRFNEPISSLASRAFVDEVHLLTVHTLLRLLACCLSASIFWQCHAGPHIADYAASMALVWSGWLAAACSGGMCGKHCLL